MKASVLYLVRFRISPSEGGPFLNWLEGGHIAEVIQEPGFIWARHYRLEGLDEYGWNRYLTIYGIDSQDSLNRYFDSSRRKQFLKEADQFRPLHQSERFHGTLGLEISSPAQIEDEDQVIYCRIFTIRPKGLQTLLNYYSHDYIAEVIKNPGFLWARRVHLHGNEGDKWDRCMIIYGLSNRQLLKVYLSNPINKKVFLVSKNLTNELQIEEFIGTLELALD